MKKELLASAFVIVSVLGLYVFTLHPFFLLGDSGEFVVVAKTGGVAHPPGSPLYTLISYLVASIPLGNLVIRLNLLSAVFGALAVTAIFLLVYKLTKNYFASLLASLALALSHLFWFFSIIPEVYTLSLFLNILTIFLFAIWSKNKDVRFLYATALIGGLSLSVHYVNLATLLLIAFFALPNLDRKFLNFKNIFFTIGLFLLGLSPIITILFAAPNKAFINWGNIDNFSSFVKFVLRSDYQVTGLGETISSSLVKNALDQWPFWFQVIYKSFGLVIFLAPFAFFKKQKRFSLFILLNLIALGPLLVLLLNYPLESPYPDVALNHRRLLQQFHILSFPYIAILAGIGANNIFEILKGYRNNLLNWTIWSSLSGILISVFLFNYPKIASARNLIYKNYGENILKTIDKPTIIITGTEESNILNYFYAVEGRKVSDIRLINFSLMQHKWYVDQIKNRYPDVHFPFEKVVIEEKLDNFYEENLKNFSIIFAPLDDQASQSVSDKFSFTPYGVTVELVKKSSEPGKEEFVNRNINIFKELIGKDEILDKIYKDEATNETLMAYARAFTNIGLRCNKLGDEDNALFFLDKAQKVQPEYYTSNLLAASIYINKSDLINAAKEYEKVIEINPQHTNSLRNLSVIYYQLNNKYQALEYGKKYLKHAKTNDEKKDAQEILLELSY